MFESDYPYPPNEAVRSIALGILLTILTCGLYGLYWQYKQMETLNAWLDEDEYSFFMYLILSFITCGVYALYNEYKMANSINDIQEQTGRRVKYNLDIICVVMSLFSLSIVSLAIQQREINEFYYAGDAD